MGSKEPLVSIGVPTFNRAASLQKCLASIMAQTYANIELIVSDNASTDETPDVIADYQNRDPRVRAFRQPVNCEGVPNFRFVREKAKKIELNNFELFNLVFGSSKNTPIMSRLADAPAITGKVS